MTKKEFTEEISERDRFGIWRIAAKQALESNQIDLYIEHWTDQYNDVNSRPTVERILG